MNRLTRIVSLSLALLLAGPVTATAATAPAIHDGQHDFDFNFGTWHTHIRHLLHPFTGSQEWAEMNGTVSVRKVWGGKAQLEEIEADGNGGHFEGMTLFLYDTDARQWSMYFASSDGGELNAPTVGSFKDGRGELYGQDSLNGKAILVRVIWSVTSADAHHFQQSLSEDGGKTWQPNFEADLTRTTEAPKVPTAFADPTQHDFDWQLGDWNVHMQRMLHPLSAAETWTTYDGTVAVSKVWGGRANLAEIETSGPTGNLQFLSLRLYNPQSHQWTLNFAHSGSGTVGSPMYGEFKDGRGEFYDRSTLDGKAILERFVFGDIAVGSGRDEQAFSADGGKTWEVNWINTHTRVISRD